MFNPVESWYSQPKLELYRVLWAFKAEHHRLYNIHFKLQVDASSLVQMINALDLPNAAMTWWITYILMFSFEIEYHPAAKHQVPDRLSWWRKSDEDSDYSDGEVDVEEGLKIVQALSGDYEWEYHQWVTPREFLEQEYDPDKDARIWDWRLDHRMGESLALEVNWMLPIKNQSMEQISSCEIYEAQGEAKTPDEMGGLNHPHWVKDYDSEKY